MPPENRRLAWLRLALAAELGPRRLARLRERLGDAPAIAAADDRALRAAIGPQLGRRLARALRVVDPGRVLRDAEALGQTVLVPEDAGWPTEAFQPLVDPPLALFLRGRPLPGPAAAVAVVGTREASGPGTTLARRLGQDLARAGLTVVSGFALGIDAAAHRGALAAGPRGGGTVAVLGCGLDVPYPIEHEALREEVASHGTLLSEHPPGVRPDRHHFPARNRIVAALAAAVVVAEAPWRSGAMITAALAVEMGREVLAVPGPVLGGGNAGAHALLKRGQAALCEDARDVLHALGHEGAVLPPRPAPPPAGTPALVLEAIAPGETLDPDALARRTGVAAGPLSAALAVLELEGWIVRVPGVGVRRT